MIAIKLFLLTLFLVVLLFSGYGLFAALFVFFITTVTTYVCYSLKTQLKLERLVTFIIKCGTALPRSNDYHASKLDKVKSFPKPIAGILQKLINSVINDFIKTWYTYLGPDEEDFVKEVELTLEKVIIEIYAQLQNVDLKDLIAVLIRMFQRHMHLFDECRNIINKKYPSISKQDFAICITELYEAGVNKHIATLNKGAEIDYIKSLIDIILYKFAPKETFLCESGRFMLREVLAIQLVEPLIQEFIDSHVLNEIFIDVLEPSLPLSIIQQKWNEALLSVEDTSSLNHFLEDPSISSNTKQHDGQEEGAYEPISEERTHLETNGESSMSAYSLLEEEDDSLSGNNIIRFNKFDERSSAPVYGSKSVRDHEKLTVKNLTESCSSIPSFSSKLQDDTDKLPVNNHNPETSSWGICPSSDSDVFLARSFLEMPRNQDNISEQVKVKLKIFSDAVIPSPISCFDRSDSSKPSMDAIKKDSKEKSYKSNSNISDKDEHRKSVNALSESYQFQALQVHKSGEEGMFYDTAPSCPTCMEMTLLASPFKNQSGGVVFNVDKKVKVYEHDCGLNSQHFFYPALIEKENITLDTKDDESFISCNNYQNELLDHQSGVINSVYKKNIAEYQQSFDIVSSQSDTESSSDSSPTYQSIRKSTSFSDQVHLKENVNLIRKHRVRSTSASTFKSVFEKSLSIDKVKGKKSLKKKTKNVVFKLFKKGSDISKKTVNSNQGVIKKNHSSKDNISKTKADKISKIFKSPLTRKEENEIQKLESSSISTSKTRFHSIPENDSDKIGVQRDSFMGNFVEEVAHEVNEDDIFFEEFQDANSQCYSSSPETVRVDPLSKVIAVTDKGYDVLSVKSARSIKSNESKVSSEKSSENLANSKERVVKKETYIPMYEGQVIMPHPSKLPAAWLYPIQMISIPSTEIAYEKGWEPGINKYTLYNIHYDIRIWPDLYQKHLNQQNTDLNIGEGKDTMPLIREIKRRYREFLYLHNRLTHGPMAKHMKGVLRPNRRYAMPFGRMDPDVIEGRRKILESYLVSLVSRPEMCNSREFKDFLGSEDQDEVSVLKPTKISKRQLYQSQLNKVISSIKPDEHNFEVHKAEKMCIKESQYFIHGYEIPRMFGYADEDEVDKHSYFYLKQFMANYKLFQNHKSSTVSFRQLQRMSHSAMTEPIQKPKFLIGVDDVDKSKKVADLAANELGRKTSRDGAENPEMECYDCTSSEPTGKLPSGRSFFDTNIHSIQIAAKFSEQLAADLHEGNLARAIAREKDLFESSWPLTNAILSILCQFFKGYPSCLTFERVQQSVLFSVGGVIEWLLGRQIDEIIIKERCYKYLCDLYNLIWDEEGVLRKRKPEPTSQQREETRAKLLNSLIDIMPSFLALTVGTKNFEKCCENLVQTVQYPKINKY